MRYISAKPLLLVANFNHSMAVHCARFYGIAQHEIG